MEPKEGMSLRKVRECGKSRDGSRQVGGRTPSVISKLLCHSVRCYERGSDTQILSLGVRGAVTLLLLRLPLKVLFSGADGPVLHEA